MNQIEYKLLNSFNISKRSNKKIISYVVYMNKDSKRDYVYGFLNNVRHLKDIYPDWIMRVYVPHDQPKKIIDQLVDSGSEVIIYETNGCNMIVRYLPHDDRDVKVFISRDADSLINKREHHAVEEWLNSKYSLHMMSDHKNHIWPLNGGMCGVKNNWKINLRDAIINYSNKKRFSSDGYTCDIHLLSNVLFPIYKDSYLQHYSAGFKHKNNVPFSYTGPIPHGFVGEYAIGRRPGF